MSAFHFLRLVWLLALLPGLALWWAFRRQSDTARRWRRAIDPALLQHFQVGAPASTWLRPGDALLAAWVLGALAVAGPAWQREPSPFAAAAPPLMLVLRVTSSMQNTDLPPNRLARATEKIADLLARNPDEPVGLIAYAGSAHLVLPPARDPAVVRSMAGALSPAIMPRQGDALADAVALARQVLADGGEGGSALVLADEADPGQAVRLRALGSGFPVSILAMLPPGRAPDAGLRDAATALDADLATATIDTSDVDALARRALQSSATVTRPGETEHWRDAGWYLVPLLVVVVLLWFRLVGWCSDEPRRPVAERALAARRSGGDSALVLLVLAAGAWREGWPALWGTPDQRGAWLLGHGRSGQAAEAFSDPVWRGVASVRGCRDEFCRRRYGGGRL